MIRSRRRQHLGAVIALAVTLPGLISLVLLQRPAVPPADGLDDTLPPLAGFADTDDWVSYRIDSGQHHFLVQRRATGGTDLLIRPVAVILRPDLLVYWAPRPSTADRITTDATLVGSLSGTSRRLLRLPAAAKNSAGSLIIYSLAQQTMVDQFPLADVFSDGPGGAGVTRSSSPNGVRVP